MQGAQWTMIDLTTNDVANGMVRVDGSGDAQRRQVIYKAAKLTGDFELTARCLGNCRIGLVCADNQRGFIGIQNAINTLSELRIKRTGKNIEFALDGKPVPYNKALVTEETPFYFGLVLDSGMQGVVSRIQLTQPGQPQSK